MKHVRKVFLRNGSSWIDFALSGEPVRGQAGPSGCQMDEV